MIHPELLGLPSGMVFIGYYDLFEVMLMTEFEIKVFGALVVDEQGRMPAEDEDGNIYRQGEDFPVFVELEELKRSGIDIEVYFEFNPMIAALNGR